MENNNASDKKLLFYSRNDVKPITSIKALEKLNLDLESPRMASTLQKLGLVPEDLKLL